MNLKYSTDGDLRAWLDTLDPETRERLHRLTRGASGSPKGIYRCSHCHSTAVEIAEMINPNTREIMDEDDCLHQDLKYAAEQYHSWCQICGTHHRLEWSSDGVKFE